MPSISAIGEVVKQAATEAGFEVAGIAPVRDFPELDYFARWVESGYGGEMRYLEARAESGELKRAALRRVAPWAKSVVVCAVNYNTEQSPVASSQSPGTGGRGWISRYAWSRADYHDSVMRRLRAVEARLKQAAPECETCCYVDTGPLVERVYAAYSGVGWVGKNACIINQRLGSWLFLGVILTSLDLTPDMPAPDRCGTCTRCLDACPTEAFLGPHEMDATRCISYLTIEKRGEIPEDLRPAMGRHVFGCDICQDVCPWNRRAPTTASPEFQAREGLVNPALEWLAAMSREEFQQTFRGSPVKRAKYSGLRRNVAIAMGNSGERRFLPALERLAADEDATVAEPARWAIEQIGSSVKIDLQSK